MPLIINRDASEPREIRFGGSPKAPEEQRKDEHTEVKMDDKKLDHESGGPETIREDKAGEKGAIGSGGVNAPAQEKGGTTEQKKGSGNG